MADVDKFHRLGPIKQNSQEVILKFKTHSAKENFYLHRKNVKRKNIKIRPSLSPARKELLDQSSDILEDYFNYEMKNPPHFVFADVHGNLKVKMSKKVHKKMFLNFSSIIHLCNIIDNCQDTNKKECEYDVQQIEE